MVHVRGVAVLNAIQFVKESYGPDAHERVVQALPLARAATFHGPIREASWEPLEDFDAYMVAARDQLAPGAADFLRRLGAFGGRLEREKQGFGVMVADPASSIRMGPVVWRSFWDAGRLETDVRGPRLANARILDFPTTRAICGRHVGAWEGLLSSAELECRTREVRCRLDGAEYCEFEVEWCEPARG